jgi:hypothetical protein
VIVLISCLSKTCLSCLNIFFCWLKNNQVYDQKLIVKKNNQGYTAKDEDENEDIKIFKSFSKHFDREYVEKVKAFYGLEYLDC